MYVQLKCTVTYGVPLTAEEEQLVRDFSRRNHCTLLEAVTSLVELDEIAKAYEWDEEDSRFDECVKIRNYTPYKPYNGK